MNLVEGKHYSRREEQPTHLPTPAKRFMDCLLCQGYDDSQAIGNKRKINNGGKGYRLERMMAHLKSSHKDALIDDGSRTLLALGFSRGVAAASDSTHVSAAGLDNLPTAHANGQAIATSDLPATTTAISTHLATDEWGHDLDGQQFWRKFRQQMDAIIKANSIAQVIPSAEAIAEDVMKQQQVEQVQREGFP